MKKTVSLILAFLMTFLCVLPAFAAQDKPLVLAENGETDYVIVLSRDASPAEQTAAGVLSEYLGRITGAEFDAVTDDTPAAEKELVIGSTDRDPADFDAADYGEEGVRIFAEGERLFLTGGEKRGALYSVYTFLEDFLGCRWFTTELTVIPEQPVLTVPADLDYTYIPCFRLRQSYWAFSGASAEFCAAHKLHGVIAYVQDDLGGCAEEYAVNSVHTLQWIIPRSLFDSHPEYFGCDENGNRSSNRQPCLSNNDVFEMAVDFALTFFSQYNTILSISQNDGMSFCQCDQCRAFNDAHGGTDAASMVNFVNRVAARVRETYPNARFETLAYQDSLTPPTGIRPAEDVVIRLCPVNGCVLHDFDDPACKKNIAFDKQVKGWVALTENLYMWNYSTNFQYYYALFPNITTLQNRYRYFRDNNVISVFDNGCGENMVPGEFHELKTYLVMKLMWDPDTDVERHISEFCAAYYGEAGEDVVEFIHMFEKAAKGYKASTFSTCHMGCQDGGESLENNSSLTEADVKKLNKIMARAEARSLTEEEAYRLEGLSLSWRFFKNATFAGEFNWLSPTHDPAAEAEKLYRDMRDYGITFLTEGGGIPLDQGEPDFTARPTWWFSEKGNMPLSVRIQSVLLPVLNKILRTMFRFLNIAPKGSDC